MKFREHRGHLAESMKTMVEIEPTKKALASHIESILSDYIHPPILPEYIEVEKYGGVDRRIGWDTYIVTLNGWGVIGMTDGPVTD